MWYSSTWPKGDFHSCRRYDFSKSCGPGMTEMGNWQVPRVRCFGKARPTGNTADRQLMRCSSDPLQRGGILVCRCLVDFSLPDLSVTPVPEGDVFVFHWSQWQRWYWAQSLCAWRGHTHALLVSLKVGKEGQLDNMCQNFKGAYLSFHVQNFRFQRVNFNLKSFTFKISCNFPLVKFP